MTDSGLHLLLSFPGRKYACVISLFPGTAPALGECKMISEAFLELEDAAQVTSRSSCLSSYSAVINLQLTS